MQNSMEPPKKIENRPVIQLSNTTPRDKPEGKRAKLQQKHLHTHVYCSTTHNS
jgi:hypothetical protein